jgi:hypothetical protein
MIGDRFLTQQRARGAWNLVVPDIEVRDAAIAERRATGRLGAAVLNSKREEGGREQRGAQRSPQVCSKR